MKKATLLSALSFVCLGSLSSCFTPVNLNFESSEMLKKGETEIQASGSMYNSDGDVATNFGVKLGTGLSERFNLKFRYELSNQRSDYSIFNERYSQLNTIHFVELDFKIGTGSDRFSYSLPIGYYSEEVFQFDPRFYVSFIKTDRFDMTFIPKCHIFGFDGESLIPGISLGTGFHSRDRRVTFRAEAGIDRISVSGGFALTYTLNRDHEQPIIRH